MNELKKKVYVSSHEERSDPLTWANIGALTFYDLFT